MVHFHSELPQYELRSGRGVVRLDNLSQSDLLTLIGPGGLVRSGGQERLRTFALEGVRGIVFGGGLYPKETFIIQTEGLDDMGELVNDWIQDYFNGEHGIYASRQVTEKALRKYISRHADQSE
jgi:hypothetical protein